MSQEDRLGIKDPLSGDIGRAEKSYRSVLAGKTPGLGELYRNTKTRIVLALSGVGIALLTACGAPAVRGAETNPTPASPTMPAGLTPESFLPIAPPPSKETTTPTVSAVEQAIKAGKIDIKTPAEAAQLFTPVSQDQALQLETQTPERFFLPVKNIEKRSNFQAKEFVINNEVPALGLIGIQPGDELVSLKSGSARIILPGKSESSNFYVIEVNTGSAIFQIYVKDPDAHEKIKAGAGQSVVLKPGDAILELVSPKKLPEIYGGYDLVIGKKVGNKFQKISIEEIIRIDNRFGSLIS